MTLDATPRWIWFSLGALRLAVPLDAVSEVAPAAMPSLIPGVPRVIGGVVNLRGEALPAVFGSALLDATGSAASEHLMVLERGALRLGLLVGRVDRIANARDSTPPADPPAAADFVRWIETPAGPTGVIDPGALLDRAATLLERTPAEPSERTSVEEETCPAAF